MSRRRTERSPGLRETIRVTRLAVRGLFASRLPQMASALTFRTLFALIPMLVISVAIVGAFADAEQVKQVMDRALESSGVADIRVSEFDTDEQAERAGADAAGSIDDAFDEPQPARDTAGERPADRDESPTTPASEDETEIRLEELLNGLVDRLLAIPFRAIGAVGLLTLVYAAISMLTEIERAFNQVYRAKIGRSWGRRITQYWSVLTLGSLLLFSAFYASEQFRGFGAGTLAPVVSVAISAVLLLLGYTTIPNTRVHVRTAAVGALIAAILWEIAKSAFRQYVEYSVSYAKLYGSIGVLPLFMLWIYFTWLIVLFGLQVSYGLQHFSKATDHRQDHDDDDALVDPAASLALLAHIGTRFARGKPTARDTLADELGIPAAVAGAMLERLAEIGVLHELDGGDDRYSLAAPADTIQAWTALEAILAMANGVRRNGQAWSGAVERLREAERQALQGVTLATLIGQDADHTDGEPTAEAQQ
ncbi:MAG: YihY/virulence factor BrkB family protein [Phycisphaerales bacterium]